MGKSDNRVLDNRNREGYGMEPDECRIGETTVEAARSVLSDLKRRVDEMVSVSQSDPRRAQALLSGLKDCVEEWYRLGATVRADNAKNWVEHSTFFPAIDDIHGHLKMRRGSHPRTWGAYLPDVQFDLNYWLHQFDKERLKD